MYNTNVRKTNENKEYYKINTLNNLIVINFIYAFLLTFGAEFAVTFLKNSMLDFYCTDSSKKWADSDFCLE